jgi:hypothetical protein
MKMLRTLGLVMLLGAVACKTEDPSTPWEIIHGTGTLVGSKALHPTTNAQIVDYPTRTGTLTVSGDSTISGAITLSVGNTVPFTGTVTNDGELIMTLTGFTPTEYRVLTDPDFPETYALLSTSIINSDITGDAIPEQHRIYWEFQR